MTALTELISQRDALNAQIDSTRQRERDEALPRLRALVEDYGITAEEIFGTAGRRGPKPKHAYVGPPRKSANGLKRGTPKYRDPVSGKTWSGFGRNPNWFKADAADSFLIPV